MRQLVGPVDPIYFDNPSRRLVYPQVPERAYERVFDFGCGCGRVARQLIQQRVRPRRYLGIDLHPGMITWCRENLSPATTGFEFHHHNVWNYHFNPSADATMLPFPTDETFTLVNAISVFTHLPQAEAEHYLREVRRIVDGEGFIVWTWLLFDKREFPFLHETHNALYASHADPGAAVVFDREWLERQLDALGLAIIDVVPPHIRGYNWILTSTPRSAGVKPLEIPPDTAPIGTVTLPQMPENPGRIGLS